MNKKNSESNDFFESLIILIEEPIFAYQKTKISAYLLYKHMKNDDKK